jgi:hypothetical protein
MNVRDERSARQAARMSSRIQPPGLNRHQQLYQVVQHWLALQRAVRLQPSRPHENGGCP